MKGIEDRATLRKYLGWSIVVAGIILSFIILRPFVVAILSGLILAFITRPIYERVEPKLGKHCAAISAITAIFLLLIIPAGLFMFSLTKQLSEYSQEGAVQRVVDTISNFQLLEGAQINLQKTGESAAGFIFTQLTNILASLPSIIVAMIVTLFTLYSVHLNWEKVKKVAPQYLPFKDQKKVAKEMSVLAHQIIYGTLLIGFIEGVIALIGFFLAGSPFPVLLATLVFFSAFIPAFGPIAIWVPLLIYMAVQGAWSGAIIVLITGLILTIGMEMILRAKILGDQAKINPVLMLVSVLGGVAVFGIFGFVVGPIVVIYTLKAIEEIIH